MRMRRHLIIIIGFLLTTLSVSGQENIRQIYNKQKTAYDIGRIEQAILLLQDNITDF